MILHDDLVRYVQSLPPLIAKQSGTMSPKGSTTGRKDGDACAGKNVEGAQMLECNYRNAADASGKAPQRNASK